VSGIPLGVAGLEAENAVVGTVLSVELLILLLLSVLCLFNLNLPLLLDLRFPNWGCLCCCCLWLTCRTSGLCWYCSFFDALVPLSGVAIEVDSLDAQVPCFPSADVIPGPPVPLKLMVRYSFVVPPVPVPIVVSVVSSPTRVYIKIENGDTMIISHPRS